MLQKMFYRNHQLSQINLLLYFNNAMYVNKRNDHKIDLKIHFFF
jgi:hypothetical protein